MKFYSTESFSNNIKETPEGFLACEGVAIARIGTLKYKQGEVPIESDDLGDIEVERTPDVLFSQDCIASFEGKPITLNHPPDFVAPDNWKDYAVGVLQNVRGDGDFLLADLLITDESAIRFVKSGQFRQLSCGYEADYDKIAVGKGRQTRIIGNHVALVSEGRCGSQCAIFDASPKQRRVIAMKDKLKKLLWRAIDEAPELEKESVDEPPPANLDKLVADLEARVAAIEESIKAAGSGGQVQDEPPCELDLSSKLDAIEGLLKRIAGDSTDGEEGCGESDATVAVTDSAVLTAGAVLAPNLAPCKDYPQKALAEAYATADGKQVIDAVLGGRKLADAQGELSLLFASAELLKQKRRVVMDANPTSKRNRLQGIVTPETLNEYYSTLYKEK